MDLLPFLAQHASAIWGAASGVVSGIGMMLVSFWRFRSSLERTKMKLTLEAASAEMAERTAFRASLMHELADLRAQIKECEVDKNVLRDRLSAAEAHILVLKASNEIMEKWVTFFRDGVSPQKPSASDPSQRDPNWTRV